MLLSSKRLFIVAAFVIALIGLINIVWWIYYNRTEQILDMQLGRRLTAIASGASAAIQPGQVDLLLSGDFQTEIETVELLDRMRRADSLAELFVLDQTYHVLASTSLNPDSTYFLLSLNGEYIDSLFFASGDDAVATPSYQTGGVILKSAFAPLYDAEGYVAGVLGVEANVDYFDSLKQLKNNLYFFSLISTLAGIAIGMVFIWYQRRLNIAEQRLFLNETHSFLGRMVAVVSHELKNPLMIIRASAERIYKKSNLEESQFIIEEVDRLNQIVSGYLQFAGQKEDYVRSEPLETTSFAKLILNIKGHFQSKYADKTILWLDDGNYPDIETETHPRSLRQVLLNLLINGADACLAAKRPIQIGVFLERTAGEVLLTIVDKGAGISRTDIKRIFEPFYTTKTGGSGLGLYLSKKIIEEMGGKLDIQSIKGEKTEVYIRLPFPRK